MEKKIGYVLQPLVDEIPLARAVKCKLDAENPPYLIVPRRYSLDVFSIKSNGIEPKFQIPLQKTIQSLFVMSGKYFGKSSSVEVLVAFFYDSSFLIFNDPDSSLFAYKPTCINSPAIFLVDVHASKPLILFSDEKCLVKLWDGSASHLSNVFRIRITDHMLIDLKFLKSSKPSFVVLCQDNEGNQKVISYQLDLNLLMATTIDALSVNIEDDNAHLIIPLPKGDSNRPSYLVLGSKTVLSVFKNNVVTTLCQFNGTPSAYCNVCGWLYIVADLSGQIFIFDIADVPNIKLVGKIDTIPTSITHVDGSIFYIGSNTANAMYIRITDENEIDVLNVIRQFSPVNGVSIYSKTAGVLYMAHGTKNGGGGITSFKTGSFFTEEIEIKLALCESILSAKEYIIVNTLKNSVCIKIDDFSTVQLANFISATKTLAFFHFKHYYVQITNDSVNICDSLKASKIKYENDIIAADYYRDNLLILFENSVECITSGLEPKWKVSLPKNQKCIATYRAYTVLVSWSGTITLLKENEVQDIKIKELKATPESVYLMPGEKLFVCVVFINGTASIYSIPDFTLVSTHSFGYLTQYSFQMEAKSVFINGSAPTILYANGTSIPAIIDSVYSGCCTSKGLAFIGNDRMIIGRFNESELSQIETKQIPESPYLLSLHDDPPALFAAHVYQNKFGITGFSIPSLSRIFEMELNEDEEINCMIPFSAHSLTIIGTSGQNSGRVILIQWLFNEFQQVCEFVAEGGIFALTEFNGLLAAGGRCRIFNLKINVSAAGAVSIEQLQGIQAPVICRSLESVGSYLIHFDAFRAISIFKMSDQQVIEAPFELMVNSKFISGYVGAQVRLNTYHIFASDEKGIIHAYLMKLPAIPNDEPELNEIGQLQLSSPTTSIKYVREGFAIVTTSTGGVSLLMEMPRSTVHLLKQASVAIADLLPVSLVPGKIVDATAVQLFNYLTPENQEKIATRYGLSRPDIREAIRGIHSRTSRLCSTLD